MVEQRFSDALRTSCERQLELHKRLASHAIRFAKPDVLILPVS